jgi:uncharacterized protein YcbK (DUF882 family)
MAVSAHARHARLGPHFRWREFWQDEATPPPDGAWPEYTRLVLLYLEPLRQAFGVTTVTSGYRSPERNRQVGGARASAHMAGAGLPAVAADVVCRSGTPREWYAALERLGPGGLGLYATHVHVDTRRGRPARW